MYMVCIITLVLFYKRYWLRNLLEACEKTSSTRTCYYQRCRLSVRLGGRKYIRSLAGYFPRGAEKRITEEARVFLQRQECRAEGRFLMFCQKCVSVWCLTALSDGLLSDRGELGSVLRDRWKADYVAPWVRWSLQLQVQDSGVCLDHDTESPLGTLNRPDTLGQTPNKAVRLVLLSTFPPTLSYRAWLSAETQRSNSRNMYLALHLILPLFWAFNFLLSTHIPRVVCVSVTSNMRRQAGNKIRLKADRGIKVDFSMIYQFHLSIFNTGLTPGAPLPLI